MEQVASLLRAQMQPADFEKIALRALPLAPETVREHGLLYLPRPYVVPGGRFNEMYGWDTFFIQMGLIRDGYLDMAKNVADNFLYEIRNYGAILNANRTYYLTRSQPPFLTQMLLAVYRLFQNPAWLADSLDAIAKYHAYWTSEPHLTPETGLSRFLDLAKDRLPKLILRNRRSGPRRLRVSETVLSHSPHRRL